MIMDRVAAALSVIHADVLRQQFALDDCDHHNCQAHLAFEDAASFIEQAIDSIKEGLAMIDEAEAQRGPLDPDALRDRRDERWNAEIGRLDSILEAAE
jgi:hypothetical protein